MSNPIHQSRVGRATVAAVQALLLHQVYALSTPFIEIENHTLDTTVHINGDVFTTRSEGRLAIPCQTGEVLSLQWRDQETRVLCQTRLYIGL